MKKLIIFLFTVLFSFAPIWGQRSQQTEPKIKIPTISVPQGNLTDGLVSRINKLNADNLTSFRLRQEQDLTSLTPISWQYFLRLNGRDKGRLRLSTLLDARSLALELKENPNEVIPELIYKNSAPNYAHAFTHKYVFISEFITHDSKAAPQEVINILQAARKARPNAKILLAQEFLMWEGEENTPLLKKPGQADMLDSVYPNVTQAAEKLGIDQLALDDSIFFGEGKNVFVKIGKYLVTVTPQDKLPLLQGNTECSWLANRWSSAEQFIDVSPFGVLERNRQWSRRLKIVEDNYDLIFVYAGGGHLNQTYLNDLPTLIENKDFANILLYPLEDMGETEKFYQNRYSKSEKAGITNDGQVAQEEVFANQKVLAGTALEQSILKNQANMEKAIENWKNKKLPIWTLLTNEDIFQANQEKFNTPKALENDVSAHCFYQIYLQEPRVEETPQTEACPVPVSPKHKSYLWPPSPAESGAWWLKRLVN